MQLTNHFLLNFTTLNLYLKATLLRPTCLWRDLIRMFKRSLEKGEKLHHMQKQRGTSGALMKQREPHFTIRNSDRPATHQRNSQTEPHWNSLKIPPKYHSKTPPQTMEYNSPHSTKTPPTVHHLHTCT